MARSGWSLDRQYYLPLMDQLTHPPSLPPPLLRSRRWHVLAGVWTGSTTCR
jgi:hypothetical protein